MKDGNCPRCHSGEVFRKVNGITADGKYVYVRGVTTLTPRSDHLTCICASCGYYENYIIDEALLKKFP